VSYRLDADGIVRRFTLGDRAMAHQNRQELDKAAGVLKPTKLEREMNRHALDSSRQIEERLGYQNQPVGVAEIDGLIDFMTQPNVSIIDDEYRRR
jgi:hypothetical protein